MKKNLKNILGNDEEKYNIILDLYADDIQSDIEDALSDKGCEFEELIGTLEDSVNSGEIDMKSIKQFKNDARRIISENWKGIYYYS